jgi:hypothetical protein
MNARLSKPVAGIVLSFFLLLLSLCLSTASAAQPGRGPQLGGVASGQVRGDEITPEQQAAVQAGLKFLAARQMRNGAFGTDYGSASGHAGITALAGIAFMAAGNLPGRGMYGENV